jgi:hypothetical protein
MIDRIPLLWLNCYDHTPPPSLSASPIPPDPPSRVDGESLKRNEE